LIIFIVVKRLLFRHQRTQQLHCPTLRRDHFRRLLCLSRHSVASGFWAESPRLVREGQEISGQGFDDFTEAGSWWQRLHRFTESGDKPNLLKKYENSLGIKSLWVSLLISNKW